MPRGKPDKRIHLDIRPTILAGVLTGLAVLGTSYIFFHWPTQQGILANFAIVLEFFVFAFAAYYARQTLKNNEKRAKLEKAFDLMGRFDHPELLACREMMNGHTQRNGVKPIDLAKVIADDSTGKSRGQAVVLLGYFEDLSLAITHDYAEEEALYYSLRFAVVRHWGELEHFVMNLRTASSESHIFKEAEVLAKAWGDKHSLLDEKVAFPDPK